MVNPSLPLDQRTVATTSSGGSGHGAKKVKKKTNPSARSELDSIKSAPIYSPLSHASTSTLHLPSSAATSTDSLHHGSSTSRNSPYLTSVERHHGHITLLKPENMGTRRSAEKVPQTSSTHTTRTSDVKGKGRATLSPAAPIVAPRRGVPLDIEEAVRNAGLTGPPVEMNSTVSPKPSRPTLSRKPSSSTLLSAAGSTKAGESLSRTVSAGYASATSVASTVASGSRVYLQEPGDSVPKVKKKKKKKVTPPTKTSQTIIASGNSTSANATAAAIPATASASASTSHPTPAATHSHREAHHRPLPPAAGYSLPINRETPTPRHREEASQHQGSHHTARPAVATSSGQRAEEGQHVRSSQTETASSQLQQRSPPSAAREAPSNSRTGGSPPPPPWSAPLTTITLAYTPMHAYITDFDAQPTLVQINEPPDSQHSEVNSSTNRQAPQQAIPDSPPPTFRSRPPTPERHDSDDEAYCSDVDVTTLQSLDRGYNSSENEDDLLTSRGRGLGPFHSDDMGAPEYKVIWQLRHWEAWRREGVSLEERFRRLQQLVKQKAVGGSETLHLPSASPVESLTQPAEPADTATVVPDHTSNETLHDTHLSATLPARPPTTESSLEQQSSSSSPVNVPALLTPSRPESSGNSAPNAEVPTTESKFPSIGTIRRARLKRFEAERQNSKTLSSVIENAGATDSPKRLSSDLSPARRKSPSLLEAADARATSPAAAVAVLESHKGTNEESPASRQEQITSDTPSPSIRTADVPDNSSQHGPHKLARQLAAEFELKKQGHPTIAGHAMSETMGDSTTARHLAPDQAHNASANPELPSTSANLQSSSTPGPVTAGPDTHAPLPANPVSSPALQSQPETQKPESQSETQPESQPENLPESQQEQHTPKESHQRSGSPSPLRNSRLSRLLRSGIRTPSRLSKHNSDHGQQPSGHSSIEPVLTLPRAPPRLTTDPLSTDNLRKLSKYSVREPSLHSANSQSSSSSDSDGRDLSLSPIPSDGSDSDSDSAADESTVKQAASSVVSYPRGGPPPSTIVGRSYASNADREAAAASWRRSEDGRRYSAILSRPLSIKRKPPPVPPKRWGGIWDKEAIKEGLSKGFKRLDERMHAHESDDSSGKKSVQGALENVAEEPAWEVVGQQAPVPHSDTSKQWPTYGRYDEPVVRTKTEYPEPSYPVTYPIRTPSSTHQPSDPSVRRDLFHGDILKQEPAASPDAAADVFNADSSARHPMQASSQQSLGSYQSPTQSNEPSSPLEASPVFQPLSKLQRTPATRRPVSATYQPSYTTSRSPPTTPPGLVSESTRASLATRPRHVYSSSVPTTSLSYSPIQPTRYRRPLPIPPVEASPETSSQTSTSTSAPSFNTSPPQRGTYKADVTQDSRSDMVTNPTPTRQTAEYTELDDMLSRLDSNPSSVLPQVLSEVLGLNSPATAQEIDSLPVGRVELERRRIDRNGKMKQKLSCVGINCNKCDICLLQFKEDELAVVLPVCMHVFHAEPCIRSYLLTNNRCPTCQAALM